MKLINILIIAIILLFISTEVKSQKTESMYFVGNVPQNSLYNPARHTNNKFYMSLPIISNNTFDFHTSGFAWKDLVNKNPDKPDSLRLDIEGFSKKLNDNNFFDNSYTTELFGFGFKIGKRGFLSFDLLFDMETRLNFSKGLFDLLVYGTDYSKKSVKLFDGRLLDATAYISPSVAFSYDINEQLTVGTRVKFYYGLMNVNTQKTDISLSFNDEQVTAISNIDIREANAFYKFGFSTITEQDSIDKGEFNASDIMPNVMKNRGFGIDIGATYKIREDMEISASIIDIGHITWKSNAINIKSKHPNTPVVFSGINTNYNDISNDAENYFDDMGDSLKRSFDLETKTMSSYTTHLPTKVYVGYSWNFKGHNYLQALYKGRSIAGVFENSLFLAYSFKTNWLDFSVGNTINNKFFNPNITLALNGGGFNWYIGSTINTSYNLAKASGITLYTGLNFVIGRSHKNKNVSEEQPKKD